MTLRREMMSHDSDISDETRTSNVVVYEDAMDAINGSHSQVGVLIFTLSSSIIYGPPAKPEVNMSSMTQLPTYFKWNSFIIVVCFCVLIFVIEFGNILTIVSYVTYRRLRRSKYIPVVSMAIADSLTGIMAILYLVERYRHSTMPDQPALSLTVVLLGTLFIDVSILHLVVLAIDRFVAVRFPMFYRRAMTSRCISTMTVACWLIAVAVMSPYLIWMVHDPRKVSDPNVTCYQFEADGGPVPLTFDFPIQFTLYLITCAILMALCVGVLMAARRPRSHDRGCSPPLACCHRHRSPGEGIDHFEAHRTTRGGFRGGYHGTRRIGSRAYTMVTVIIVAYITSWAPYFVVAIIRLSSVSLCRSRAVRVAQVVTTEFGTLNAGVNFIIYAFINRDFRHAYKSTLKKMIGCGRQSIATSQFPSAENINRRQRGRLLTSSEFALSRRHSRNFGDARSSVTLTNVHSTLCMNTVSTL